MTASFEPLTPTSFLVRTATVHSGRIAVIDGATQRSYAELLDRCRRQAGLLQTLGVRRGDRVAVLAPNVPLLLEAHFGVAMAGGVLVALNTRLSGPELAHIVDHAGARVLLHDDELADTARAIGAAVRIDGPTYELGLAAADPVHEPVEDERSLISLNYTSGTTGGPKGVMYHHRGAYLQALSMAFHARLGPETVHLWTLPMFHCNGWSFPWAVTAAAGTHVCLRRVTPARIWSAVRQDGVNSFNAAPTVLIDLAHHPEARPVEGGVRVGTGGAPPSPTLLARLAELAIDVTHLYGLTETFGPSVVCDLEPEVAALPAAEQAVLKARQGNAGVVAQPLRVVGPGGVDVPTDGRATGEVWIRGNTVALGYFRDEKGTARAFADGWFRTGDLGVMHPDHRVELTDRAKDIIISGGENIASIEVEQVLSRHPGVLEVAVVGAPDPRWGEVPVAFVTPLPGAAPTPEELIAFARESLAGYKIPRRFDFGDLPKTSTGKIQKYRLRERLRSGPPADTV
jgi:fatty-acyl-CoA synthase